MATLVSRGVVRYCPHQAIRQWQSSHMSTKCQRLERQVTGRDGNRPASSQSYPADREAALVGSAIALSGLAVPGVSKRERALARRAPVVGEGETARLCGEIRRGLDPLGEMFCEIRTARVRRSQGATYTPPEIVRAMVGWCVGEAAPDVVVDPGVGSGRFLVAAGRAFPRAKLVGIEIDPLAAMLARGHLSAAGFAGRSRVLCEDYRSADFGWLGRDERVLFLGNPPYVRHHLIDSKWKGWLARSAKMLGVEASGLAGLHVHFLLKTAQVMRPGDAGCLITSAEWLDVDYGRMVRRLFASQLGGQSLIILEPTVQAFPDAATTAAIMCFRAGSQARSVVVRRVRSSAGLDLSRNGRRVGRARLESEQRWSRLTRPVAPARSGFVELGELCRVHRGQVTGANAVWIAGDNGFPIPERFLFRTVTRAKELYDAGSELCDAARLRSVINLPVELDELSGAVRMEVEKFLRFARSRGADRGYIARHRRAWWSVGLREPAPILATYMARRPPAFVRNTAGVRHLNIAHGLYPRVVMTDRMLQRLVAFLRSGTEISQGRTYAGGLTKFEPREMERIPVPGLELLERGELG